MDIMSSASSSPDIFMVKASANASESMLMAFSIFVPSLVTACSMALSIPALIWFMTCVIAEVICVSRLCTISPDSEDITCPM